MKKVVSIIGAGVAGISCSKVLLDCGFAVKLFEKLPIIGGRIASIPCNNLFTKQIQKRVFKDSYFMIDHGSQYFTARSEELKKFVAERKGKDLVEWDGIIKSLDFNMQSKEFEINSLRGKTDRFIGINYIGEIFENCVEEMESDADFEFFCNHEVNTVDKTERGDWLINNTYKSDFIVLTGTPNDVKSILGGCENSQFNNIEMCFQIIKSARMKPVAGLIVELNKKCNILPFDGAFVNHTEIATWMCRENSKGGKKKHNSNEYWIIHFCPHFCQDNYDLFGNPTKVFELVEEEILSPFGWDFKSSMISSEIYMWEESDIVQPLEEVFFLDEKNGVGVAADWINNERVEGAFLSGYHLGKALLQSI